jgi:hypothetical protein
LILAAGYWGYGQITTFSNKRNFQQARQTIDSIYSQIVDKVGLPDNTKKDSSCSRSYQEFNGYVDMSCDVDTSFVFSVSDKVDAQMKINLIQKIINDKKDILVPSKPINTIIRTTGVVTTNYYGTQNFYKYNGLSCTSKYVYDTPEETFLKIKKSGTPLYVVIGCTGPAKKQYYPLNQ